MPANVAAGTLDRRITVQVVTDAKDAAGDVVAGEWSDAFKLWARRTPRGSGVERPTSAGVLREFDMMWDVRDGAKSRTIAPETHRLLYQGRIYEVVGIVPGMNRSDLMTILSAARPDQRGSRGDEGVSGQP